MVMTDPIADMLTRIRNANKNMATEVEIPNSKIKLDIAKLLKDHGFIRDFKEYKVNHKNFLKVELKYGKDKSRIINGLKRISKPGLRIYVGKDEIPRVLGGLGLAIISTPKGVISDKESRKNGIGGEVLCYVW
ncbi:MAG: 30S ribosomal protein S8 [Candidatus Muiribacterium halophilum]|uniref:Small ribosomal subunit protein uS8 n=1 Tax=Muiribacterium halophilum TaxID=2053465 RepID=A0A2N5ZJJ9_MUIH1|nr:MAG: 30S ribosomal protein S8 [Candidatus Muirbacterium halophilum]